MRKSPLLLTLFGFSAAVFALKAAPGDPVPLFNGHDLEGWVIESGGRFVVDDGHLRVDRGTGWLRSEETFDDFTLIMEFRFLEPGANSGVFVRTGPTSHDNETGWPDNGYQVQCIDSIDQQHPLGSLIHYGGSVSGHEFDTEAARRAYKPTGEWQTFEIRCSGGAMSVALNGEQVTTAIGIGNLSGHVGIQAEDGLLEFRRIDVIPE